jgi:hypothetical protein
MGHGRAPLNAQAIRATNQTSAFDRPRMWGGGVGDGQCSLVPIQKTAGSFALLAAAHCLYVLEEFTFLLLLIGKGY